MVRRKTYKGVEDLRGRKQDDDDGGGWWWVVGGGVGADAAVDAVDEYGCLIVRDVCFSFPSHPPFPLLVLVLCAGELPARPRRHMAHIYCSVL